MLALAGGGGTAARGGAIGDKEVDSMREEPENTSC